MPSGCNISIGDGIIPSSEPITGNYFIAAYPPFSSWNSGDVKRLRRDLAAADCNKVQPLGLYVHIPFCVQRCDYCYYRTYDDRGSHVDSYLEALLREARGYRERPILKHRTPRFAYFGGGTPSLLSDRRLARLLGGLDALWSLRLCEEVTFECSPKTVTPSKLRLLREHGVTRLSLGVQQLDDAVLRANGRVHLIADVERAWEAVREIGFEVTNVDLIAGMIGETDRSFEQSLQRLVDMRPDSLTLYQMEIPANTRLYDRIGGDGSPRGLPSWATKRRRLDRGLRHLEAAGYTVVSPYAAVGDPERHRFLYTHEQYRGADLLGFGASAFSYFNGVHYQNTASLRKYLEAMAGSDRLGAVQRAYALSPVERMVREFVLQLKLEAVSAAYFREKFGADPLRVFARPLRALTDRGWITIDGDEIRWTRPGLLRVDRLLPMFYLSEHRPDFHRQPDSSTSGRFDEQPAACAGIHSLERKGQ